MPHSHSKHKHRHKRRHSQHSRHGNGHGHHGNEHDHQGNGHNHQGNGYDVHSSDLGFLDYTGGDSGAVGHANGDRSHSTDAGYGAGPRLEVPTRYRKSHSLPGNQYLPLTSHTDSQLLSVVGECCLTCSHPPNYTLLLSTISSPLLCFPPSLFPSHPPFLSTPSHPPSLPPSHPPSLPNHTLFSTPPPYLIFSLSLDPTTPSDPCDRVKFILGGDHDDQTEHHCDGGTHSIFTELEELKYDENEHRLVLLLSFTPYMSNTHNNPTSHCHMSQSVISQVQQWLNG